MHCLTRKPGLSNPTRTIANMDDDNVIDLNTARDHSMAGETEGRRERRLRYAAWALFVALLVAVLVGIDAAPTLFTSLLDALDH